jgi:DNA-binding Lrp family transcriptional regulator
MKTTLKALKYHVQLNTAEFARALGVNESTLAAQIKSDETVKYTVRYMKKLNVKKITGFENNTIITIEIQ